MPDVFVLNSPTETLSTQMIQFEQFMIASKVFEHFAVLLLD
jgi:hypothetical protein